MKTQLTGFKATTEIKPSLDIEADQHEIRGALQSVSDLLPHDTSLPAYWSMTAYDPAGKHNHQSVQALTGVVLEYEKRYEVELLNALKQMPWHFLIADTERKSGQFISVFFPLAFEPDVNRFMRIAGVLVQQLGVYGLSRGSGTPTFLVKLAGGQQIHEHSGPAIGLSFISDTKDVQANGAIQAFQGPKPVAAPPKQKDIFDRMMDQAVICAEKKKSKQKQIAANFRMLADLFDPE